MSADTHPIAGEKRDLRKGAWQILSGFGVRMAARILLIVFVARMYGIEDFGRLGEIVAVVELLATFATFGLAKVLLGRLSEDGQEHQAASRIAEAAGLVAILSFSMTAILWAAWPLLASQSMAGSEFVLFGIPLIALSEIATTATRHFRTAFWDTLVKALVKPWSFLILAVAAYYWLAGTTLPSGKVISSEQALLGAYIGSLALTACAALFATTISFGRGFFAGASRPTLGGIFDLAKRSFPIALNDTSVYAFRRIDIIILAVVAGPKATGIYYLAQQIATVVEKVRYLFEPVLAPIVAQSKSLDTIGEHLRRLGWFIFAAQTAIIVLFAIFGEPLLTWFGSGFAFGLFVVLAILVGELLDGSFGLCELPMVYRHPAWPPRMALAALAIEVVLVWILATQFGALGAAIGFATAMLILAAMRIIAVRSLYGFRVLSWRQPAVATLAIGIVLATNTALIPTVFS